MSCDDKRALQFACKWKSVFSLNDSSSHAIIVEWKHRRGDYQMRKLPTMLTMELKVADFEAFMRSKASLALARLMTKMLLYAMPNCQILRKSLSHVSLLSCVAITIQMNTITQSMKPTTSHPCEVETEQLLPFSQAKPPRYWVTKNATTKSEKAVNRVWVNQPTKRHERKAFFVVKLSIIFASNKTLHTSSPSKEPADATKSSSIVRLDVFMLHQLSIGRRSEAVARYFNAVSAFKPERWIKPPVEKSLYLGSINHRFGFPHRIIGDINSRLRRQRARKKKSQRWAWSEINCQIKLNCRGKNWSAKRFRNLLVFSYHSAWLMTISRSLTYWALIDKWWSLVRHQLVEEPIRVVQCGSWGKVKGKVEAFRICVSPSRWIIAQNKFFFVVSLRFLRWCANQWLNRTSWSHLKGGWGRHLSSIVAHEEVVDRAS